MKKLTQLPLLALRGNIIFPHNTTQLEIARVKSVNTVKFALENGGKIIIVSQLDSAKDVPAGIDDFFPEGVYAEVTGIMSQKDDILVVAVRTLEGCHILRADCSGEVYFADAETIDYYVADALSAKAMYQKTLECLDRYANINKMLNKSAIKALAENSAVDYISFVDVVANDIVFRLKDRQEILAEPSAEKRMEDLCVYLLGEMEIAKAEKRIANRVKKQVEDGQKEYYLREKMRAISKELGEDENEMLEYRKRIEDSKMPAETAKKANKEISRLSKMAPTSPDASVIRNYVDWLCDIPWYKETTDNTDLNLARRILDEDHYGLEKIKQRIIEYLAVMQLTGKLNGPILCFVGPPGVGKTSIVKSIARALGRKYLRVSLGGVRDEAEIRGHRRTYVGAIPGKIIYMMKQAGVINPVLLLDEIDKMGKDQRGDPASAMLEVLDPQQNNTFTDHFLEVPYDLSKVLFVCTANATDDIPEPLLDRMEIIELSGYTEQEKVAIAEKFLLPKNMKSHGIPEGRIVIGPETFLKVIERYTRESGVRSLEREVAGICRKVALKLVEDKDAVVTVTPENLHEFLGVEKFKDEAVDTEPTVGSATGLAWTRVGGTTLEIDATLFPGKGEILLTGKLGDVMKESARTAISLVRSLAEKYGIDKERFEKTDIHIHVPEGAIPKDGPSAGVTMATVIMSAFTSMPVSRQVAMTGEITLRGKVLPIGGLKEKALAAYRLGIKKIIIPKDNLRDVDEIPQDIASQMQFIPAETIDTVFDNALIKV